MRLWETAGRGFPRRLGIWRVNFSVGQALRTAALLGDENIGDEIKYRAVLSLLLCAPWKGLALLLPSGKRRRLAERLLDALTGQSLSGGGSAAPAKRLVSLERDGALIYAALLQSYGIDLLRDRIDWRALPALLAGVSSDSCLYRVMEIRAAELPDEKTAGAAAVQRLKRLKRAFSLEEETLQQGFERLFSTALSAAEKSRG